MADRLSKEVIAMRVAKELRDGDYVNLGRGIPLLVSSYILDDKTVFFHCEAGLIGYGRALTLDEADRFDYDLIDANGQFVTPQPGMCIVDHCVAFDMIRGGRLDVTVLGAMQVSQEGDLANWTTHPDWRKYGASLGGAMDMPVGAKRVIVAMTHTTRSDEPKLVKKCTYPLTARKCVSLVVTDIAVVAVGKEGFILQEVAPGWTPQEVQDLTEAELMVSKDLKEIQL